MHCKLAVSYFDPLKGIYNLGLINFDNINTMTTIPHDDEPPQTEIISPLQQVKLPPSYAKARTVTRAPRNTSPSASWIKKMIGTPWSYRGVVDQWPVTRGLILTKRNGFWNFANDSRRPSSVQKRSMVWTCPDIAHRISYICDNLWQHWTFYRFLFVSGLCDDTLACDRGSWKLRILKSRTLTFLIAATHHIQICSILL